MDKFSLFQLLGNLVARLRALFVPSSKDIHEYLGFIFVQRQEVETLCMTTETPENPSLFFLCLRAKLSSLLMCSLRTSSFFCFSHHFLCIQAMRSLQAAREDGLLFTVQKPGDDQSVSFFFFPSPALSQCLYVSTSIPNILHWLLLDGFCYLIGPCWDYPLLYLACFTWLPAIISYFVLPQFHPVVCSL